MYPSLDWLTELRQIQSALHRLFERLLGPHGRGPLVYPDINVRTDATCVEVVADLPGVSATEVRVY